MSKRRHTSSTFADSDPISYRSLRTALCAELIMDAHARCGSEIALFASRRIARMYFCKAGDDFEISCHEDVRGFGKEFYVHIHRKG